MRDIFFFSIWGTTSNDILLLVEIWNGHHRLLERHEIIICHEKFTINRNLLLKSSFTHSIGNTKQVELSSSMSYHYIHPSFLFQKNICNITHTQFKVSTIHNRSHSSINLCSIFLWRWSYGLTTTTWKITWWQTNCSILRQSFPTKGLCGRRAKPSLQ